MWHLPAWTAFSQVTASPWQRVAPQAGGPLAVARLVRYAIPDDEHQGNDEQIRRTRHDGLQRADAQHRATHRNRQPPWPTNHHRQPADAA
ncbi:hypothetical protein [Candidatus Poriferisodalis sp.]|uniref:hypothetical protein n=1 Tax=Candidatus Poriferisodalis sp. TaxID=3101277 RepID=UPI003B01D39E